MRGKSELKYEGAAKQTSSGLNRDYITQWSYGIGETFSCWSPMSKEVLPYRCHEVRKQWKG